MFGYVDAAVFFTQKNNPDVKIVSRYYDQGAMGGGADPEDYETVLKRPITPFFRLETRIDTNNIDKAIWIKVR